MIREYESTTNNNTVTSLGVIRVVAVVEISPIVLKTLVNRGVLDSEAARNKVEQIAETRDWLGAPIYRRALQLFD